MAMTGFAQQRGPFKIFVRGDNDFSLYLSRQVTWLIVERPEQAQVEISFSRLRAKVLEPKITIQDDRGTTTKVTNETRCITVDKDVTRITFDIRDPRFPAYGYGSLFYEAERVADIGRFPSFSK